MNRAGSQRLSFCIKWFSHAARLTHCPASAWSTAAAWATDVIALAKAFHPSHIISIFLCSGGPMLKKVLIWRPRSSLGPECPGCISRRSENPSRGRRRLVSYDWYKGNMRMFGGSEEAFTSGKRLSIIGSIDKLKAVRPK